MKEPIFAAREIGSGKKKAEGLNQEAGARIRPKAVSATRVWPAVC